MEGKIDVNITFDDNNQIRVLPADKFRETEQLKGECITFVNRKSHSFENFLADSIERLSNYFPHFRHYDF